MKPIKFFTADPHFGHEGVLEMSDRPFASVKEHDDYLLDQINSHVMPEDELFILGDFCFAPKPGHYRNRIKCRTVHLIWGNHDRDNFKQHFSTVDDVRVVKLGQDSRGPGTPITINAFLSHYPHAYWPTSHKGQTSSLHFYGHCHDQREETLDTLLPNRRSTDVGVDTAKRLLGDYRPFSDMFLICHLWTRPGHDHIEFYEARQRRAARERVARR